MEDTTDSFQGKIQIPKASLRDSDGQVELGETQNGRNFLLLSPLPHAALKVLGVKYGKGKEGHSYENGKERKNNIMQNNMILCLEK